MQNRICIMRRSVLCPTQGHMGHRWGFELLKFQLPNHQGRPLESNTPYSPTLHPWGTLRAFENHVYQWNKPFEFAQWLPRGCYTLCDLDHGVHNSAPKRTILACETDFKFLGTTNLKASVRSNTGKYPTHRAKIISNSTTHAPPIPLLGGWGIRLIGAYK